MFLGNRGLSERVVDEHHPDGLAVGDERRGGEGGARRGGGIGTEDDFVGDVDQALFQDGL